MECEQMNKQVGFYIFRTIILKWLFIRFPLKVWVCQDVRENMEDEAVGAVRVGWAGHRVLIYPAMRELGAREVNLVLVGTSEGKCTMMEGEVMFVKVTRFLECVSVGLEYCAEIAGQINMVGEGRGRRRLGVGG